jgi:hypothetical protein
MKSQYSYDPKRSSENAILSVKAPWASPQLTDMTVELTKHGTGIKTDNLNTKS